jgi:hypothetical protein
VTAKTAVRSADCLQQIVRALMVSLVGLSLAATSAQAQVSSVGTGSARLNLNARLTVGYAMKVRQNLPARIVERTATATEVELPVTAASNANWTLSVSNQAAVASDIEILDANGTWRDLNEGSTAAVYASGQPTNGQPVMVRLRLAPGASLDSLSSIRLLMTPSER